MVTMCSTDKQKHVFPAQVDEIANICQLVTDKARSCGMDEKCLWKLETAVDEACTNISCYSYKDRSDGKIWISCSKEDGFFYVTLKDTGCPFDQSSPTQPEFDKAICDRSPGGLGRFIMKQFLDDMKYERHKDHNVLTLIKRMHYPCE